ncbi:MAG: hypothetical protein Q9186_000817 [Xanthomendoza sp. 1 TL-2023]
MQQIHDQHLAFPNPNLAFSIQDQLDMSYKKSFASGGQVMARQKRRRTSPEDQVILEAAYKSNPKPDKSERVELLKKVTLGEKELSIWFQNRRQVSRRRSRPLGSDEMSSQEPTSSSFSFEGSSQDVPPSQLSTPENTQPTPESGPVQLHGQVKPTEIPGNIEKISSVAQTDVDRSHATDPSQNTSQDAAIPALQISKSVSDDALPHITKPVKCARKPQYEPFTLYDQFQSDLQTATNTLPPSLKRTASHPRLATSLDGSVRVKIGNSPTPSPPRPQNSLLARHRRVPGLLQRSQSAIVPPTFPVTRSTASIGRSRDSRTWEFYCDPNARDELTKQAEREQSGSAVGAIGLIRSRSKGSLATGAKINPNKRVAAVSKPDSGKRLKADIPNKTAKPKLARATSSVARLQGSISRPSSSNNINQPSKLPTVGSNNESLKKKPTYTDLIDGNESDKENWAPGTQTSVTPRPAQHRRPNTTASQKRILMENQHIPSLSSSLDALLSRESSGNGRHPRRGAKIGTRVVDVEGEQENENSDTEVRGFMASNGSGSGSGSGENVVVGEEEGDEGDLDCVQGLLKLSRGDWP